MLKTGFSMCLLRDGGCTARSEARTSSSTRHEMADAEFTIFVGEGDGMGVASVGQAVARRGRGWGSGIKGGTHEKRDSEGHVGCEKWVRVSESEEGVAGAGGRSSSGSLGSVRDLVRDGRWARKRATG